MDIAVSCEQKKPESREEADKYLTEVVDPEIEKFSLVFADRSGGEQLKGYERELLRAYLWWRLVK